MLKLLNESEMETLEKYRFKREIVPFIEAANLLQKESLVSFLQRFALTIGAPSERVAASIFMKRYAFVAVISLFAMTAWNKKLNVGLSNIVMEEDSELPGFSFKDLSVQDWKGENREAWRKSVIYDLFANNISPLIAQLEIATNISKIILWENIAVYLFWLYEKELSGTENALADLQFLIAEAPGELFGDYLLNPLSEHDRKKVYVEEFQEEVRIRKTCCFSYKMKKGTRCKTCPCRQISKDGRCHDGEQSVCAAVRCIN